MGGVVVQDETGEQMRMPPDAAPDFVRNGWMDLQDLTPSVVADRSKADHFTKIIACLQTTWFLLQLVGRAVSHLTITTLELSALAYVFCALGTFGFWLQKPLDVHLPLIIHASPTFTPACKRRIEEEHRAYLESGTAGIAVFPQPGALSIATLCCALFGGCHILAWNAHFPSHIEQILWRASSVSSVVLSFIGMVYAAVKDHKMAWLSQRLRRWLAPLEPAFAWVIALLYIAARLYLLFDRIFSLRSVSPEVYTTVPWAQYIPHF
jgi:hypothetical protein